MSAESRDGRNMRTTIGGTSGSKAIEIADIADSGRDHFQSSTDRLPKEQLVNSLEIPGGLARAGLAVSEPH